MRMPNGKETLGRIADGFGFFLAIGFLGDILNSEGAMEKLPSFLTETLFISDIIMFIKEWYIVISLLGLVLMVIWFYKKYMGDR